MAAVFVADQYLKIMAFASERMSNMTIIPWLFGFMHHENHGIVANIPIPQWLIIGATIVILALITYLTFKSIQSRLWLRVIAYSMIAGGALGNLYDRLAFGYVRDWILLFDRSVINLADIAICVGILLLLKKGLGIRH